MTIAATPRRSPVYTGNGVATTYAFAFKVLDAATVVVTVADANDLNSVVLVNGVDYTVTLNPDQDASPGGEIGYAGLPVGHRLVITSATDASQPTAIANLGAFHADVIEAALDRIVIQHQQQQEQLDRCVKVAATSEQDPTTLLDNAVTSASNSANAAAGSASAASASALAAAGSADAAADLFTSTGASLIGYTHPGVGAVPRTQDKKNAEVVTPEDFGAAGDGATDDTAKIQAAVDALSAAGGGDLILSQTYLVKDIVLASNVNLRGVGGARLIKNGGLDETYIAKGAGTLGASTAISAPVSIGAASFTVSSAAGFAEGDWIIIRDASYVTGSVGRNQEINRIAGIAGTTITLQRPVHGSYSGSQEMVKLTPVENVTVEGLSFEIPVAAGGNVGGGLHLQYAVGCVVRGNRFTGSGGDAAVGFSTVAFSQVEGNDFVDGQNMSGGGYGYGIEFNEATHHCIARGNTSRNIREHTFTNRARFCTFVDNVMSGHYDSGFNTHGSGVTDCLVANNVVNGTQVGHGLAVGWGTPTGADERISVVGNTVRAVAGSGISVAGGVSIKPSVVKVLGNLIHTVGLATSSSGILITGATECDVSGNTVYGANDSGAGNGINVANASDVRVSANRLRSLGNGYGITVDSSANVIVQANDISGASSHNVRGLGTSTDVTVRDNVADDTTVSIPSGWASGGNSWDKWIEQVGTATIPVSGAASGYVDVVFPVPFASAPIVLLTAENAVGAWTVQYSNVSTSGFRATATDVAGASRTGSFAVAWLAKGR